MRRKLIFSAIKIIKSESTIQFYENASFYFMFGENKLQLNKRILENLNEILMHDKLKLHPF